MHHVLRFTTTIALAFGLLVSHGTPAAADHASISGTVTNSRSGSPISGVCVKVGQRESAPCWTYTNSAENYQITPEPRMA